MITNANDKKIMNEYRNSSISRLTANHTVVLCETPIHMVKSRKIHCIHILNLLCFFVLVIGGFVK